jgi:acetyltransferase
VRLPDAAESLKNAALNIEVLRNPVPPAEFSGLCGLLAECVRAGASIGFVEPMVEGAAEAYWQKVAREAAAGSRIILVAREADGGPITGTAQLAFESKANGRHRAEVQKVLVGVAHRRKGIAAALMASVESAARDRKVTLLFLDTSEGAGGAQKFYETLGYTYVGGIPGFAVDPDGTPAKNAIYYKTLT